MGSDACALQRASRFTKTFERLKESNGKAFMPYVLLGYPDRLNCLSTVKTMIDAGASALELGIAFSDPMADGPIITQCARETIESGFGTEDALALVGEIRVMAPEMPITLLVYFNTVLAQGIEGFYRRAKEAGVDAVLIADMSLESSYLVAGIAREQGVLNITLASPMSGPERLARIAKCAEGFVYVVSRLGITGVDESFDSALEETIATLKSSTVVPLIVGFGISSPEQGRKMIALGADGVITGSRILQLQGAGAAAPRSSSEICHSDEIRETAAIADFARSMVKAVNC